MSRLGALILLLTAFLLAPAAAADRAAYLAAREKLEAADFESLDADQRDRLFEALAEHDHVETVKTIAEVGSRFGTYLVGLEYKQANLQERLRPFIGRSGLNPQEAGVRNNLTKQLERAEADWRWANESFGLLVKALGSFSERKTVNTAVGILPTHPTWRVRQLFAGASGSWHEALKDTSITRRTFGALKKLQHDKEPRVRVAVARALASFERIEALHLLGAAMQDEDWSVRLAAVTSLRKTANAEAVGILVEAMQKEKGRMAEEINSALEEMTGLELEFADLWARWWDSVGGQLPARRPGEEGGGTATPTRKAKDTDRFYGIPTRSDRIMFIIDVSGSMKKEVEEFKRVTITGRKNTDTPVGGKTRIHVAKNELKRAIGNLNRKKRFSIIFFNHATKVWRDELVEATPANKEEAYKAIDVVRASGATYTLGALREAFAIASSVLGATKRKNSRKFAGGSLIDTIYLVSDGGPTDNKSEGAEPMDPEIILDNVAGWNRDLGLKIHTIAVHTEPLGTYFLRQLAAQNNGIFRERKKR